MAGPLTLEGLVDLMPAGVPARLPGEPIGAMPCIALDLTGWTIGDGRRYLVETAQARVCVPRAPAEVNLAALRSTMLQFHGNLADTGYGFGAEVEVRQVVPDDPDDPARLEAVITLDYQGPSWPAPDTGGP